MKLRFRKSRKRKLGKGATGIDRRIKSTILCYEIKALIQVLEMIGLWRTWDTPNMKNICKTKK